MTRPVMRGFVGNTNYEWYRFLREQPALDEVNFWQPSASGTFRALTVGEPFFFRLKHPYRAIAGFGFFVRYSVLPL